MTETKSTNQPKPLTVSELAEYVSGEVVGDGSILIRRLASLEAAATDDLAYVEEEKLFPAGIESKASCLLVPGNFPAADAEKSHRSFILVANPKLAFTSIAKLLHPPVTREPFIHSTAVIASSADVALSTFIGPHTSIGENSRIGANTRIESGVSIGADVTVGSGCVLHPNVVLYDGVSLGDHVILHAGVCVGADGFGYVRDNMGYQKFPQIGTVIVEDDVEIGAHTCIDRAALGRTRIGRGTKVDNLVQVGHNVDIGERVVIAAQTGISGSVVIEDDVVIGGQVGFGDHIRVLSGAVIGSKAGILPGKIVRAGIWWGVPIQPLDEYKRRNAHIGMLPQLRAQIKQLRKQVRELQEQSNGSKKRD